MCFGKYVTDVRCDADGALRCEASFTFQRLRKRLAFDEFHDDEVATIWQDARVEDHRGVRVTKFRHRACLAHEAVGNIRVGSVFGFDDFDGDGISNLQEYLQHTDPTDYYNGVVPMLEIVSGDNQVAGSGALLASPLIVRVSNSLGQALANAPVTFLSWGFFSPDGDSASLVYGSLTVRSDANGLARAYYQTPLAEEVEIESILAQAQSGSDTVSTEFTATTDPARPRSAKASPVARISITPFPGRKPGIIAVRGERGPVPRDPKVARER